MADKKRYADNKCFVISDGGYEEITYAELCRRREQDKSYESKRFIPLHGMLMEVTPKQYQEFYKEKRRQKYLMEKSVGNGDVSIDALLTEDLSGVGLLVDWRVDVAAEAENNILIEKLEQAMQCLSHEELLLIRGHYYDELTEAELAGIYGISQQAVSKRLRKLREKLRKLLEK